MGTGEVEAAKQSAGIAACDFVHDGMDLGLGTGGFLKRGLILEESLLALKLKY